MSVPAGVRVSPTAESAELLVRFAELVSRGDLDGDEPIIASLLRIHAPDRGPYAWEDLLSATRRITDIRVGIAERCTDAELDLALDDRDDALWLLLHGEVTACPACRISSRPVDQWCPIGTCRWHGEGS